MKEIDVIILNTDNKIVYCADWPVRNESVYSSVDAAFANQEYEHQCEEALANGIEFKDQEEIKVSIWYELQKDKQPQECLIYSKWQMEPLKPYAIPESIIIKIETESIENCPHKVCVGGCPECFENKDFALIKSQPKEETQHDLWLEALSDYSTMESKFRIERIK